MAPSITYDRPTLPRLPHLYIILGLSVLAWSMVEATAWGVMALFVRLGLPG